MYEKGLSFVKPTKVIRIFFVLYTKKNKMELGVNKTQIGSGRTL